MQPAELRRSILRYASRFTLCRQVIPEKYGDAGGIYNKIDHSASRRLAGRCHVGAEFCRRSGCRRRADAYLPVLRFHLFQASRSRSMPAPRGDVVCAQVGGADAARQARCAFDFPKQTWRSIDVSGGRPGDSGSIGDAVGALAASASRRVAAYAFGRFSA